MKRIWLLPVLLLTAFAGGPVFATTTEPAIATSTVSSTVEILPVSTSTPVIPVESEATAPIKTEPFESAIVIRASTGKELYSYQPDKEHTAASLTKLALAITMLDKAWNWNTVVTMQGADEVGGGRLQVATGAKVRLANLWDATLGSSANNAATALARVGGPGVSAFVKKMNAKVKAIGATSSVFYDPSGMNAKNHTTARDMALIAKTAFSQTKVQQISQRGTYRFSLANGAQARNIKNTNLPFLEDPEVWLSGGKTGYLPESGYNYAGVLRPMNPNGTPDTKREVIVVVLGASTKSSSFASVKRLAEEVWAKPELFRDPPPAPIKLTLTYGMIHAEVRALQTFLAKDKTVYPEGQVTGKFGGLTLAAVQRFQKKYSIAKPGDRGYGVVGPATRAKIASLSK
ncbi:serine hydrolase [Patescibacteria group bacterium]|jgi:D-alanyl-D-alanine endopeptidase (penicillin-binding protein 7)|nr:serine hydrolase [Patescibacteria group bacterium]